METVTVKLIADTRRKLKSGLYPVKLRVTFRRKQKYYSQTLTFTEKVIRGNGNQIIQHKIHSLTESDFKKAIAKSPRGYHKFLQDAIKDRESKAIKAINNLPEFSFELFERYFLQRGKSGEVQLLADSICEDLKSNGRIGTAESYDLASRHLNNFRDNLKFSQITPTLLLEFEKYLLSQGKSHNSVGVYMRAVRVIVNEARSNGLIRNYPFKTPSNKNGYKIPATRKKKRALEIEEIHKMINYLTSDPSSQLHMDMWTFSLLASGMNLADLIELKWNCLDGNTLTYYRKKTARTEKENQEPIVIKLGARSMEILEKYASKKREPEDYIFKFISLMDTAEEIHRTKKNMLRSINTTLDKISQELELGTKVSFYYARHSFASQLAAQGVNLLEIQNQLGHSDLKTTQTYLSSLHNNHEGFESLFINEEVENKVREI